eukprot:scaffold113467_cov20-Cyclotella_meneghiniana.AAC.1
MPSRLVDDPTLPVFLSHSYAMGSQPCRFLEVCRSASKGMQYKANPTIKFMPVGNIYIKNPNAESSPSVKPWPTAFSYSQHTGFASLKPPAVIAGWRVAGCENKSFRHHNDYENPCISLALADSWLVLEGQRVVP